MHWNGLRLSTEALPERNRMDLHSRLILALLFIGLAVFRLIRYIQIAMGRRRISAVHGTSMQVLNQPVPADADLIPALQSATSDSLARRGLGLLAGVASWAAGNALLWIVLFDFQYLGSVAVFWRLFADVFANLYLIRLSRHIAERVGTNRFTSASLAK